MKKLIYIKDIRRHQEVSLLMLLDDIGIIGNDYIWSILELEAVGSLDKNLSYSEIENTIQNHPTGYCLSWDKLKNLASKFEQVINIIIVASKDISSLEKYKNDYDKLYNNFAFVIEIRDGDFWEVCTSDESLISRIKNKYKDIEIKEV